MIDPLIHLALFLIAAVAIMFASSTFSDAEDRPLLRALPRRLGWFCLWCAVLTVSMVIAEHTLASTR